MGNKHPLVKSVNHVVQTSVSVFAASILSLTGIVVCAILGSVFLNAKTKATIDSELYYLEMTTPEYVNIDVTPGPNGSIAIGASEVTITSTTPSGYGLYLSGGDTLHLNGDPANIASDKKIISTSGTYMAPISLTSNATTPATWGYAIAGRGNFDDSYSTTNPSMDAKFAAVPAANSEQLINQDNEAVISETSTIYYGINANTGLTSGEYQSGAVSYYSLIDISSMVGGELTVSPSFVTPGQENTITITTSLSTEIALGNVDVVVGNTTCTTKTITSTTPLTITCVLPDTITWGHHDVEVNVSKFGKNYAGEKALHALYAMQNINETIVSQMVPEQQYQFYDLRDNKIYFASKLADGNVWMTQNLDFEIPTTDITLSTETTDSLDADVVIKSEATWSNNDNAVNYRDGGDLYYAPSTNLEDGDSARSTIGLSIDDEKWHYHVGSYYSMAAATAKYSLQYDTIDTSICPKGWRIPQSTFSSYSYDEPYQYESLLYAYNYEKRNGVFTDDNGEQNLLQNPLYFARAGFVKAGSFAEIGIAGQYMTGTGSNHSYNGQSVRANEPLYITSTAVSFRTYTWEFGSDPDFSNIRRSNGTTMRCVAWAPHQYTIVYNTNGGKERAPASSAAPIWDETQSGIATIKGYTQRVGFTQIGWSEDPNATTPTYEFGQKAMINHDMVLYAVWKPEPIYQAYIDAGIQLNSDGYFTMQDMTDEICAAVPTPDKFTTVSSRLLDVRDNKLYYVSKFADGNCWMSQNLDFEISSEGTTLSPSTSAVFTEKTITAVDWDLLTNGIMYYDGGDKNVYSGTNNLNESTYRDYDYNWHYHVGSYYSYNAATAGSGATASSNALESICPKGWRLPVGRSYTENKSFGKLTEIYNFTTDGVWTSGTNKAGTNMQYSPLFFQLSGYMDHGAVTTYRGSAIYWSATSYGGANNPHAYYMSFSGNVNIAHSNEKYVGGSVRCVQGSTKEITIHYDANGGSSAPADTTTYALTENTVPITLSNELPVWNDNTFLGWATTPGAYVPEYQKGASFPAGGEHTLYAVWDEFDKAFTNAGLTKQNYEILPNNGEGKFFRMQDMTPEICAAVHTPTTLNDIPTTNLLDARDNFVYFVSKYADGNCWMTQNLDYRPTINGWNILTPDTSDVSIKKEFVESNPQSSDIHNQKYVDIWDRRIENGNGQLVYMTGLAHTGNTYRYHAGNLYSYDVATMHFSEEDVQNGVASNSICPRGWTLPQLSGEQSFVGLFNAYGIKHNETYGDEDDKNEPLKAPLYFTRAGQVEVGASSISNVGTAGAYWARNIYTTTSGNNTTYRAGGVASSENVLMAVQFNDLAVARSVRCVVKNNPEKLVTFVANDPEFGGFTESVIAVPAGTTYEFSGDTITFSNGVTSQAVPNNDYGHVSSFAEWQDSTSGMVTDNMTIQANFNGHLAFNGITYMQEMTPEICAAAVEGETLRPIDIRDGERYWITKLADGRCWMTEDLDFAIASEADGGTTLDPATSNVSTSKTINSDSTTGSTYRIRRETSVGDGGEITRYIARNHGTASNYYNGVDTPFDSTEWHYRIGTFYGYGVATAGSGDNITSGNATESICPKGWYLPSAGYAGADFNTLSGAYGLNMWETNGDRNAFLDPLYFYRNGWVDAGQANVTDRGNYGLWRSSTASGWSAYNGLAVYGVGHDGPHSRAILYNVRCIAETE